MKEKVVLKIHAKGKQTAGKSGGGKERKEKKEVQRGKTVDVEVDAFTGSYAVPKGSQPVGRSSSVWFSSTLYGLV